MNPAFPAFRFIRLVGCEKRIIEYAASCHHRRQLATTEYFGLRARFNQEACRVTSFDGKKSLIRSFPVRHRLTHALD